MCWPRVEGTRRTKSGEDASLGPVAGGTGGGIDAAAAVSSRAPGQPEQLAPQARCASLHASQRSDGRPGRFFFLGPATSSAGGASTTGCAPSSGAPGEHTTSGNLGRHRRKGVDTCTQFCGAVARIWACTFGSALQPERRLRKIELAAHRRHRKIMASVPAVPSGGAGPCKHRARRSQRGHSTHAPSFAQGTSGRRSGDTPELPTNGLHGASARAAVWLAPEPSQEPYGACRTAGGGQIIFRANLDT